jgi:hypothetical protein
MVLRKSAIIAGSITALLLPAQASAADTPQEETRAYVAMLEGKTRGAFYRKRGPAFQNQEVRVADRSRI